MDEDGAGRSTDRAVKRVVVSLLGMAMLAGATWAAEQGSDRPWVGIVGAMAVAAVTMSLAGYLDTIGRMVDAVVASRTRQIVAGALVVALVAAVAARPAWRWARATFLSRPAFAGGCPPASELRILTSADSLEPTRELTRRYTGWTAEHNGQCPTVHVYVYAATTAPTATSALARGWRTDDVVHPLVDIGPRPDVWLPDSTVDVRDVRDLAAREHLPAPIRASRSIGSSPIVLVTRAVLAGNAGSAWPGPLPAFLDTGQPLLAADPELSSLGVLGASGYLGGASGDLVPLPTARKRSRVVAAGEGGLALLCRWGGAEAAAGRGLLISEQLWRRYAATGSPGGFCPSPAVSSGGYLTPVAADAPVLDHPLVEFTWSTPAQRAVVDAFRQWLAGPSGTDAVRAVSLRPARGDCSVLDRNPCVPVDVEALRRLHRLARQPGRVLLVLDASGSMSAPVGPTGQTRFAVATRAVNQALGQLGPADSLGLWIFPGRTGTRQELIDIDRAGAGAGRLAPAQRRKAVADALRKVRVTGGTPLYDAVVAGMTKVGSGGEPGQPRALIVLTDGRDTASGQRADRAGQAVHAVAAAKSAQLFVVATGEASCTGPQGLDGLTAGIGRCFDVGPDQIVATIAQLFDLVWRSQ